MTRPGSKSARRRLALLPLVAMKSSAFPYFGNNPRSEAPFLNISKGDRKGHRSYGGRVYWQDETYNDSRVLVHVPETFDVRKPGVIVVFFHGNGATLERDVRDRQLVPQQISDSGVNAVLLAPQLAVDAADSSAGKFWQPGGLKRFVTESADHLARLYGDPRTDEPFLNVSKGDRRGHRGLGGKVFWQDETYNDNRVLMHVPENFDIRKPGVIVVFFHGNGATLERDVRDRQLVPQQISESGVNAVLLAPQLAVDAADSSAGKFWQPGGLKRFVAESAEHLAGLYGDPGTARAFANMPVVIVGYSGGFMPAAWSLEVGGLGNRVRGVFLLDAVYGELDKFASWIVNNRSGFFVSCYTHHTKRHDDELIKMLKEKGIAISEDMDGPLRPGSVVFIETQEGVTHRDYVTHAWTENPVREMLVKMAATPALTRMAASAASSANR